MTESVQTTLEEASRCPRCQQPGKLSNTREAPKTQGVTRGAKLQTYVCENRPCKWYGQVCRVVQVNPDGTIPPALLRRDKNFPAVPDMTNKVNEMIAAQIEAEKAGGAEIPFR